MSIPVKEKEIKDGLWALKAFKAPRPNGLHAGFYQRFWMITGKSVMDLVKMVFKMGCIPSYVNKTLITLIPKHSGADSLRSYRLISLCNTVYKVISKVIVARLRSYLDRLISLMQVAFVLDRKCADNAIIIQELLHMMSLKKCKVGYMAVKIDLEKAYDRLEWSFIRDILALFNISHYLSKVIMSCISTSNIEVLFNGGALVSFNPSRGIRRGDPLSPYIFIVCMEVLVFFIQDKCNAKLWDLVKTSKGGLVVSHLFFADELVLFAKTNMKNCLCMMDALEGFCGVFGQKTNKEKSRAYFSPNVVVNDREKLCEVLGIRLMPKLGKYLTFPLK